MLCSEPPLKVRPYLNATTDKYQTEYLNSALKYLSTLGTLLPYIP